MLFQYPLRVRVCNTFRHRERVEASRNIPIYYSIRSYTINYRLKVVRKSKEEEGDTFLWEIKQRQTSNSLRLASVFTIVRLHGESLCVYRV